MEDDLRTIAGKNFSTIMEFLDRTGSPEEKLPYIMVELCKNLNMFYRLDSSLSISQFGLLLEDYLFELNLVLDTEN